MKSCILVLILGSSADLSSTMYALNNGAREANPIMTGSTAKMVAIKAGGTAGIIYLVNKLKKNKPKTANIVSCSIGAGFGAIAVHNIQVGR